MAGERRQPYNPELSEVLDRAVTLAKGMGHAETGIGHIGLSLPEPNAQALARVGIYGELFRDILPPKKAPIANSALGEEVNDYLVRASRVAKSYGSDWVLVSHLTEAMVSPDLPHLMELKFMRGLSAPIDIRNGRNTEAA